MTLKKWINSSRFFNALLIISVLLLTFLIVRFSEQVKVLTSSTQAISRNNAINNNLNLITTQLETLRAVSYRQLSTYKPKSRTTPYQAIGNIQALIRELDSLSLNVQFKPKDLEDLKLGTAIIDAKVEELFPTSDTTSNSVSQNITEISLSDLDTKIENLKGGIANLKEETQLALLRAKQQREAHSYFTPQLSAILIIFCLAVFVLSFLKINLSRRKKEKANLLLQQILFNSQTLISYYKPIFNDDGEIIDFNIDFTNHSLKSEENETSGKTTNTQLLEHLFLDLSEDLFDNLLTTYNDKSTHTFKKQIKRHGKSLWISTTASYLNDGILTSSIDITEDYKSALKERELYERLSKQNLHLLDNKALLNNIFKSISNIVVHFKALRNDQKTIVDFKIVYANDAITPLIGDIPETIKGQKASTVFPEIFENGTFENLVRAIEEGIKVIYKAHHNTRLLRHVFEVTAIKLDDGVTATMRDITHEVQITKEMQALNEALATQNSIFKDAESVAKIGSYIWYLDSGEAIVSDNFFRILGYEPNAFTMTHEKYKSLIHPEDRDLYEKMQLQTKEEGHSDVHAYRVITKEGHIKHLYLNSQRSYRKERPVSIGVVRDITNDVLVNKKLRDKNMALERINQELESFNRVVSHDLQEPTRKIQLFISRILEIEAQRLSEKGTLYFKRVANAANRMQTLIKYLLSYSRLSNQNEMLTEVNLNDIIDGIISDLPEELHDDNVTIDYKNLPRLKGIPFQMEQLFANIISNAIKYRNPNGNCTIEISSKQLSKTAIKEAFNKRHRHYHFLEIKDNGIGFDPLYKDQIFKLFERLHQRDEYEGTGIGLAICKKIVENHKGHILANSTLGKGATFTIFLPVQ
ncbi:ATP-binding protein [uncultured Winogradskyella sp.]|uniref:PAS domain-containing sensor histidine kinase n=1 Tax=uncultured Winogradskyella sp. TaxID=395353 RepID=UPI0035145B50